MNYRHQFKACPGRCAARSVWLLGASLGLGGCDAQLSRYDRVSVEVGEAPSLTVEETGGATPPAPSPLPSPSPSPSPTSPSSPAPEVDVGADASANAGVVRTIVVAGGEPVTAYTYRWTVVSGGAGVVFADATSRQTTISASSDGTFVIRGTATDADGQQGSDTFTLVWDTTPPVAPTSLKTTYASAANPDVRYSNDTDLVFAWNAASDGGGSGVRDYTLEWFNGSGCAGAAVGSQAAVAALNIPVPAADGTTLSFRVTAYDQLGQSSAACSDTITVDTQDPPALDLFSGVTGPTAQTVTLTINFPAGNDYASVDIRRVADVAAPADCNDGVVVKSYDDTTAVGTTSFDDDTGGAGRGFSYRACLVDHAGNATSSDTLLNRISRQHLMFGTSILFDGALTPQSGGLAAPPVGADGVERADHYCGQLGASLSGDAWRAVISGDDVDARDHVAVTGKIVDPVDTLLIATDRSDLWDGSIGNPVFWSEASGINAIEAWTGSNDDGTRHADRCIGGDGSWDDNTGGVTGVRGFADIPTDGTWFSQSSQACSGTRSLYCISQAPADPFGTMTTQAGAAAGTVDVAIAAPAKFHKLERVEVRRQTGASPPVDCAAGTLAGTLQPVTAAMAFTDAGLAGGTYSYRACAYDAYGNMLTSKTAPSATVN